MLPIRPEPTTLLAGRYPAAVAELVDAAAIERGERETPGKDPRHVFDFEDGTRLIVSRELIEGAEVTHFSASVDVERVKSVGLGFLDLAVCHFREISGWKGGVKLVLISEGKQIPHWVTVP